VDQGVGRRIPLFAVVGVVILIVVVIAGIIILTGDDGGDIDSLSESEIRGTTNAEILAGLTATRDIASTATQQADDDNQSTQTAAQKATKDAENDSATATEQAIGTDIAASETQEYFLNLTATQQEFDANDAATE